MIESSLVTYYGNFITASIGATSEVEFDFEKIWNFKKSIGADFNIDALHWYHVHPENMLWYSQTDLNCVKGFNLAFGDLKSFSIITFDGGDLNDLSHKQITFDYNKQDPNELALAENFPLQDKNIYLLKALSYGYVTVP